MSGGFKIRIVYIPLPVPEAKDVEASMPNRVDEEIVEVKASTLEAAVERAMLYANTPAKGRSVRYYDERGQELFTL